MPDANFNSGFLQEAFRLREQGWDKYGDPNLYTDQQIRQNQSTLGAVQLQGAYQQNQMQQLQAMKQMQDIRRSAEEDRINNILYPVNDGSGNNFFANLRQIEALKTAQSYTQQVVATENLRNQSQLNSLKTAEAVDQYAAARVGTPKLMDFKDRLGSLVARVKSGGEDGALAYKELETMRADPSMSQFTDATGQTRYSPEMSSAFEKVLDDARKEARATDLYQAKESTIKEFSDSRMNLNAALSFREDMSQEEFEKAFMLKNKMQKYFLNMDHNKPDPEEIGQLVYEASQFNPDTFKQRKLLREGVSNNMAVGIKTSKITTGPKGVEVEGTVPTGVSTGESFAGKVALEDKKGLDDLEKNISETNAQLAAMKSAGEDKYIDPKTGVTLTEKQLEGKLASYENDYVDKLNSNPNLPKTVGYERIMAAKGAKKTGGSVPNVISGKPAPSQQATPPPQSSAPVKTSAYDWKVIDGQNGSGKIVSVQRKKGDSDGIKTRDSQRNAVPKQEANDLGPTKGKILYSPSGFANPSDVKIVNDPDLQVKDGRVFRKVTTRKGVKMVDVTLEGYGVG
jgi:hypothetical protein